jgi:hypothetical protein
MVDCGRVPEISVFVHRIAVKVENPSFDIPSWDQMDDSFLAGTQRLSFRDEALFELPSAMGDVSCIRIDRHDKRGLCSSRSRAIRFDGWRVPRPYRSFSTSSCGWQGLEVDVMCRIAELP